MKLRSFLPFAAALLLAGCSGGGASAPDAQSGAAEADSGFDEASVSRPTGSICYLTDHGTVPAAQVSSFSGYLESLGCSWTEVSLAELPLDADAVIFNTPTEDLTLEELVQIETYMAEGGHLLLLMPASNSDVRYKYLERLLREYCIVMDYDIITENDPTRISGDLVQMDAVNLASGMTVYTASMEEGSVWMQNARSFHTTYAENYGSIHMDAMIETAETAVGTPCGGVQDDPLTYENEKLITMMYARNEDLRNAVIVAVGSSDFLLDANFEADSSADMQAWIYTTLAWMTAYLA